MQIYLDMDGVLADFDAGANHALKTDNSYKWEWINGTKAFWDTIDNTPNFWDDLPQMDYAYDLLELAFTIGDKVSVLTALPKKDADPVRLAKEAWIENHFSPFFDDLPVITCVTSEKPNWSKPGAILVDDRAVQREPWEAKGGNFVLYNDWLSVKKELNRLWRVSLQNLSQSESTQQLELVL